MSMLLNIHNIVDIKIKRAKTFSRDRDELIEDDDKRIFYTQEIVFVQENGTKFTVCTYSDTTKNNLSFDEDNDEI
jgi:hypothetical protein